MTPETLRKLKRMRETTKPVLEVTFDRDASPAEIVAGIDSQLREVARKAWETHPNNPARKTD